MTVTLKGLEFDPGFAPYIMAFQGSVEYLYSDINRFKNLSQRKMKFMQYNKKIIEIFNNNIGFFVGCLMWAAYIKTQPKQKILSNNCFGQKYDEKANIADTQFMLKFTELFPKDMKYFLGQNYEFDENIIKLLKVYEEFLIINKGFTESEYNTDIQLPKIVKTDLADSFKDKIDNILKTGNLSKLIDFMTEIL